MTQVRLMDAKTRHAEWLKRPGSKEKVRANAKRFRAKPDNADYRHYESVKRRYGLTQTQYDTLKELQGGRCAICRQPPTGKRTRLHVDHDHGTGEVRGLLCNLCNVALGSMHDDPAILRAAIVYLASEHLDVGIAKLV